MNKPSETELEGMTVNERLFAMGLLDQWDEATKARDRGTMILILSQCAMSRKQCDETTDAVLKNPSKYGY